MSQESHTKLDTAPFKLIFGHAASAKILKARGSPLVTWKPSIAPGDKLVDAGVQLARLVGYCGNSLKICKVSGL